MMVTGERRAGAKGSLAIALAAVSMVVLSTMTVADAAPLTPPLFAPACPREAHVVGGLHSNLAFQSSLPSGSLALRPASCSSQTGFSVGRQLSGGVRTLVSQYRGRGGGGGGGRGRGRGRGDRRPPVQKGPPMNEFIPFPEMRVVVANPDGKDTMLGVMSKEEALARAEDLGMDLVVVSPEAQPPVCKIINYDKLRYELEKKEKMKRKNQTVQEIKEVKLSYKIDTHDYEVRVKAATKFLTKGDKVKASIRFKGREMAHRQLAEVTMQKLANDLKAIGTPEKRPMLEGKIMLMTINPTDAVVKAAEQMRKEKLKNKAKKGAAEEEEDSSDDEDEAELAALNAAQKDGDEDDDDDDEGGVLSYDMDALSQPAVTDKIDEVGARIRDMKAAGADKAALAEHVDELLALKARYQEMAGQPWSPAPANA